MNTILSSALSLYPVIMDAEGKEIFNPLIQYFSNNEAVFLYQLHKELTSQKAKVVNSERWIGMTYSEWAATLNESTQRVRYIFQKLRNKGVVRVEQLEENKFNKRFSYTIDYKALEVALGIQSVTQ